MEVALLLLAVVLISTGLLLVGVAWPWLLVLWGAVIFVTVAWVA